MLALANPSEEFELRYSAEQSWPSKSKSANEWFCRMFPTQVRVFGSPFLEQQMPNELGNINITPLVPNHDCLAACIGGDERLGHRVIYYSQELQFYFFEPRDQKFHATTDQKVGNLLRGLLARCAMEVTGQGHLLNTFHTFRADPVIKAVVNRCKSLLAADPGFFNISSPHQRVAGPELHQRVAMVFAQQLLEPHEGSVLTIGQSFALFNQFAKSKNLPVMKRSLFKGMIADVVQEEFGLGLRNDIVNAETQKQGCGWKGLRVVEGKTEA